MNYCPECKHFIWCDPYKMIFYAGCTAEKCPEYEESKKGGGEDAGSEVRDEH